MGKDFINECSSLEELLARVELRDELQYSLERIFELINIQLRSFKRYVQVGKNDKLNFFPKFFYSTSELKLNDSFYGLLIEEYINGNTLESADTKSYGLKDIIDFLHQMGYLIKELSESGIVHRDISPDNIMVLNGTYILIDPGVVKIQDDFPTEKSHYIFGKKIYVSPEQYMGYAKFADFSSDLYSVGIIAMEMGLKYNPIQRILEVENAVINPHQYLSNNLDRKIEDEFVEKLGETNSTYQLYSVLKKLLQVEKKFRFDSPDAFIRYINIINERFE